MELIVDNFAGALHRLVRNSHRPAKFDLYGIFALRIEKSHV